MSQREKQEGGGSHFDFFLSSSGSGAGAGAGDGTGAGVGGRVGVCGFVGPGPPGNARIMEISLFRAIECGARDPQA